MSQTTSPEPTATLPVATEVVVPAVVQPAPSATAAEPTGGAPGSPAEVPQAVAAPQTAAPAARPEPPSWALERIDELTRKARLAEERAANAERAAAEARAGKPGLPVEEVQRQAQALASAQNFERECATVHQAGKSAFADFDAQMGNFQRIGGTNPVFLAGVLEQGPDAPRVIYELSKDLGEASRIMQLDPVRQAAAITRYAMKLPPNVAQPAAPAAPAAASLGAPIAAVALPGVIGTGRTTGSSTRLDDPRTSMSDWVAERNKAAWDKRGRKSA